MIVDAGTSSITKENIFQNKCLTPVKDDFEPTNTPSSAIKEYSFKARVNDQSPEKICDLDKKLISSIRYLFEDKKSRKNVCIKTIIITHPDVDHYNLFPKIFHRLDDKIEYIILGGLPESYDVSGKLKFGEWLDNRLRTGSKIYFPAIQYKAIESLNEILPNDDRPIAPPSYTPVTGEWPKETVGHLKEAVDFGDLLKVSFLAINPLHHIHPSGKVMRIYENGDDNRESIVIKIQNPYVSGILMGDATETTTTVIQYNYFDHPEFLEASWILAAHHGSSSHGSNHPKWLKSVNPIAIFISNGKKEDHPDAVAYANFKQCLENRYANCGSRVLVNPHKVLVGKDEKHYLGSEHTTTNPIFSTLVSKTITITYKNDKISVDTESEGTIDFKVQEIEKTKAEFKTNSHIEDIELIDKVVDNVLEQSDDEELKKKRKRIEVVASVQEEDKTKKKAFIAKVLFK
ncbi:MAG: hypothetical protein ACRYGR_06130 [Janthinobacterium lividum]